MRCYQLLMRSTTRVRAGPVALRRLHMPSSQHHNTVWHLSTNMLMTRNCTLHCQNLTRTCLSTSYRTACQLCICGSVRMALLSTLRSQRRCFYISTSQQARASIPPLTGVNVAGCVVPLTDTVKILGVTIDHHLTFNTQVYKTSASRHTTIFEH